MTPQEARDHALDVLHQRDAARAEAAEDLDDPATETCPAMEFFKDGVCFALKGWREIAERATREARVLRGIVQEDHPDELQMVRGMREYHAKERRRRRAAERERDEARERVAELEREREELGVSDAR